MKKYKLILVIILLFIVLVNLIGLLVNSIDILIAEETKEPPKLYAIIKVPIINQAFVFAHGRNYKLDNGDYAHVTIIDEPIATVLLLNELKEEGYNKVWMSVCDTEDEYAFNMEQVKIKWDEYDVNVRRKKNTYPIFLGVWMVRI